EGTHFADVGCDDAVPDKQTIGLRESAAIMEADGVSVEKSDIVCLHTGFADELLKMGRSPDPERVHSMCASLDGADQALLDWNTPWGPVLVAAQDDLFSAFRTATYIGPVPNGATANESSSQPSGRSC